MSLSCDCSETNAGQVNVATSLAPVTLNVTKVSVAGKIKLFDNAFNMTFKGREEIEIFRDYKRNKPFVCF